MLYIILIKVCSSTRRTLDFGNEESDDDDEEYYSVAEDEDP